MPDPTEPLDRPWWKRVTRDVPAASLGIRVRTARHVLLGHSVVYRVVIQDQERLFATTKDLTINCCNFVESPKADE